MKTTFGLPLLMGLSLVSLRRSAQAEPTDRSETM